MFSDEAVGALILAAFAFSIGLAMWYWWKKILSIVGVTILIAVALTAAEVYGIDKWNWSAIIISTATGGAIIFTALLLLWFVFGAICVWIEHRRRKKEQRREEELTAIAVRVAREIRPIIQQEMKIIREEKEQRRISEYT